MRVLRRHEFCVFLVHIASEKLGRVKCYILGMLSNILNLTGVSAYYQTLAVGIVILLAVTLDQLRRRFDTRGV